MCDERAFELRVLNKLEARARLLALLRGRQTLTAFETRALALEQDYLRCCQTRAFRARWGERFAARDYAMQWTPGPNETTFEENTIGEARRNAWIAMQLGASPAAVGAALARATLIAMLEEEGE